jgi:8-oxo-dGTP diphosphatase
MLRSVHRVAAVILVDSSGRLLLQLRDGGTTKDPHRWGPPGGRVEPGEEPYEAAVRELEEETGLRVDRLELFWSGLMPSGNEFHFYCGATTAGPDEIECNEGAAMEFVDAALISDLDLTRSFSMIFPRFIDSPQYAALRL